MMWNLIFYQIFQPTQQKRGTSLFYPTYLTFQLSEIQLLNKELFHYKIFCVSASFGFSFPPLKLLAWFETNVHSLKWLQYTNYDLHLWMSHHSLVTQTELSKSFQVHFFFNLVWPHLSAVIRCWVIRCWGENIYKYMCEPAHCLPYNDPHPILFVQSWEQKKWPHTRVRLTIHLAQYWLLRLKVALQIVLSSPPIICYLILLTGDARDWTRQLLQRQQALYHWAMALSQSKQTYETGHKVASNYNCHIEWSRQASSIYYVQQKILTLLVPPLQLNLPLAV